MEKKFEQGCYVDVNNYLGDPDAKNIAIIKFANDNGAEISIPDEPEDTGEDEDFDLEIEEEGFSEDLEELADEAIEFLNENCQVDGLVWQLSEENSLVLAPEEE